MLLNHTSGIFNYTDDLEALNRYETHSPESLVQIAVSHPPTFTPGAGWAYSNTNYVLAGVIIERVTGRALAEEITERISRPLGLTDTYLPHGSDPTIHGPHSRHYTKLFQTDPGAPVHDATELDSSVFWAAGGVISTAGDLNRFFGALLGGRILPPDQQRDMFTTVPTRGWISNAAYGLGVSSVRLPCGETVWGMGVRSSDRGPTPTALGVANRWSPPTSTATGAMMVGTTPSACFRRSSAAGAVPEHRSHSVGRIESWVQPPR
jgi:D-alanyl-D-alanine carboxypeptidase